MTHNLLFKHVDNPRRRKPAEYVQGMGWFQEDHNVNLKKRRVRKPYYHLVWPKDGNRTRRSRWRDIWKGEGPDIHLVASADKNDYMHNRPRKSRWARHTNLDDRGPDNSLDFKLPWIKRDSNDAYDFRTRTWRPRYRHMWTDALRLPKKVEPFDYPYAFRDIFGDWKQLDPHAWHHEFDGMPPWHDPWSPDWF